MNLSNLLLQTENQLKKAGIVTSRLDSLVLIENELGKDRAWILAHLDEKVSKLSKKFAQSVQRRANHEPLAYILGKSEFYGREFIVNNHTLVPRPESETMIDLAKKHIEVPTHIIDVGCGSGAIGITALLEKIGSKLTMIDIDKQCLNIASKNALKHGVDAVMLESNLLEKFNTPKETFIILTNLPYVPDSRTINKAAMQEPKHAIFGGPDGLNLYRALYYQIAKNLQFDSQKPKLILTESLPFQHQELIKIAQGAGYKETDRDDFVQVFSLD